MGVTLVYREISITEFSNELLDQLRQGAFLVVKAGEKVNIMTISCGSLGYTWMRPTFTVMIRYSRYTYALMESADSFAVSFPLKGQLKTELNICGTASGRYTDKARECKLSLKEGRLNGTMVVDDCDLHLECKVIYKNPVDITGLDKEIRESIYRNADYHVFYIGEIVRAYIKE